LHEEQVPVRFSLASFLQDAEQVDGGEEVAPREVGFGLRG
jgi:hypothetical protein